MLFLGFESAVQYWRVVRSDLLPYPAHSKFVMVECEDHLLKEVDDSAPDLPIDKQSITHVLVHDRRLFHKSKKIEYHLCAKPLPAGSFCQHVYGVVVASPELTLLQAAQDLGNKGFTTLLELCCEFFGDYSLDDGERRGFVNCQPLVTRDQMLEYLGRLPKRTYGAKILGKAVELAGEHSRSPRETECYLAMTLPPELGGFGLPRPILNLPSPIDDGDASITDDRGYLVDLAWNDGMVIFEYDGVIDHTEKEKVLQDKERRSVLASMGKTVIVATKESASNDEMFRKKVAQVFRALDIPLPSYSDDDVTAQSKLRETLFDPAHHSKSPYITPIIPKEGVVGHIET